MKLLYKFIICKLLYRSGQHDHDYHANKKVSLIIWEVTKENMND